MARAKARKPRKRAAPKPKVEPEVTPPLESEGLVPFEPDAEESVAAPEAAPPGDGTLIRQDGYPVVFVMKDGKRRAFRDAEAFTACGFGWGDIVVLGYDEVKAIPTGEDVAGPADLA